jgi:hypothetical protein
MKSRCARTHGQGISNVEILFKRVFKFPNFSFTAVIREFLALKHLNKEGDVTLCNGWPGIRRGMGNGRFSAQNG